MRASETERAVRSQPIFYPSSDGQPMAETEVHRDAMIYLIESLKDHFRKAGDMYIGGNMFVYFVEGDPRICAAPDFFAVRDTSPDNRERYKVWLEDRPPEIVIELTSWTTRLEDLGKKRRLYEKYGILEYFIFDPRFNVELPHLPPPSPFAKKKRPRLEGFVRKDGRFVAADVHVRDGRPYVMSRVLGLELHAFGRECRWVDPATRLVLPAREGLRNLADAEAERADAEARRANSQTRRAEAERQRADVETRRAEAEEKRADSEARRAEAEERRADAQSQRAEAEAQRAEAETRRADAEARRAEEAEAEIRRLRAELESRRAADD